MLGFQALLGVSIIFAALSLMVAANGVAVLLCLAVIVIAGPLFWLLDPGHGPHPDAAAPHARAPRVSIG